MERLEAAHLGLVKYSTGRPCKNNHEPLRYTRTGQCCGCLADATKKWNKKLVLGMAGKLMTATFTGETDHIEALTIAWRAIVGEGAQAPIVNRPSRNYAAPKIKTINLDDPLPPRELGHF